jgi:hypothetical protein
MPVSIVRGNCAEVAFEVWRAGETPSLLIGKLWEEIQLDTPRIAVNDEPVGSSFRSRISRF